jgi:VWFA-related protein
VDGEMLPGDWVAVVSYDTRLKVQQDFTHDRQALIAAIGDALKAKDPEGNYASRIDATKGPSLLAGLPRGEELLNKTPKLYDALQVIARSAGNIRGRKNLLLFTYGLPSNETTFGQFVPDKRYFLPTVDALNANNVAVYSLDLTPPAVQHTLSDSLQKMSDDTGGRYFYNVTNFSTPLEQIAKENNGYYLLSYQSDQPAGKPGFQNVTVTTTNPEFRVKARKGYEYGK